MMRRLWTILFTMVFAIGLVGVASAANVKFSGQVRLRPEYKNNPDLNDSTDDTQAFVGSRTRLTANAQATSDVSAKITLQDTRNWGSEASTATTGNDTQAVDIYEGYFQIKNFFDTGLTLKAGRQVLSYGDQRLIGAFGWSNSSRTFDAFKATYADSTVKVDAWAAKLTDNNTSASTSDNDHDFYGVYATFKNIQNNSLDVYLLLDRNGNINSPSKPKAIYTLGARLKGKVPGSGIDYTLELPYQTGDNGTQTSGGKDVDIQAWAFAGRIGYTVPGYNGLRIGAEVDYASGDKDSTDDTNKTFTNLYATNHAHYGSIDFQGWRNMFAWSLNVKTKIAPKLLVKAAYWSFSLAEKEDNWYGAGNQNGTGSKKTGNNGEDKVGSEVDLTAVYKYNKKTKFVAGYSHFFTDNFVDQAVTNEGDADFAFVMGIVNF